MRPQNRVGCYTWRRLRADLVLGNGMAALCTVVAFLPTVLIGIQNALESVYQGALVMRWTSLLLFFCVLSASYFAGGNLAAVAIWLLRPLRMRGIAGVPGYALTGGLIAAIVYPVLGFSLEMLARVRGDLSMVGITGEHSWADYREMVAAFGVMGVCGGVWWWFKEETAGN